MYRLGEGFAYCCAGSHAIFLDLTRNHYLCLKPPLQAAFSKLVERKELNQEDHNQLNNLLNVGILTQDIVASPLTPPFVIPAMSTVRASKVSSFSRPVLKALLQRMSASASLRLHGLDQTVKALKRLKEEIRFQGEIYAPEAEAQAASAFEATHLLFSANDRCLPQAIALFRSLLAARHLPLLIFGVRMNPFSAHCWVQSGERVFCDSAAYTRQFTPILII
ncbi:lasso peptide biosynthesis B2 protein [Sphingobium phenoxybenzoativorans]|uniref:Lasso peptide biosynthesis B2 protein n=1 Tax=Sphingobium phenoxybenzoativorans TaxID=1592790 RepID=A0A975Q1Q1_9SPHN|nr:lasso peptide biosynthesis B2 protein [Sphingobium phenoxybenzoativorans]QUT05608.1 lasso peptide biosynthesis B2 protein [Sphingobium phenoxybenzoativorans]